MMNLTTAESISLVEDYVSRLRERWSDLPPDERDHLLSYARAQIELDIELEPAPTDSPETVKTVLERLGAPEAYAQRLRLSALPGERDKLSPEELAAAETPPTLVPCRGCRKEISREAYQCPHCGAPFPARSLAPASGYEWKSKATFLGWPMVHVAFGRDKNGKLRVAKGVVAIGQFGIGAFTFAQFGVGLVFGLGQFVAAPLAIGQFALGIAALGQFGIGLLAGAGQVATGLLKTWGMVTFGGG